MWIFMLKEISHSTMCESDYDFTFFFSLTVAEFNGSQVALFFSVIIIIKF